MEKLARFAVRRRWWVALGWVAFAVLLQVLSSAAGGADYRNDFKLPHTETQTVSRLLSGAGLGTQNGATGTMVLHTRQSGTTIAQQQAIVQPALQKLCTSGDGIAGISSPYGEISCQGNSLGRAPPLLAGAQAALVGKDQRTGLVQLSWVDVQPANDKILNVYHTLTTLNSAALQVEFTGDAFQIVAQQAGGIPPELFGFIAALIILLIAFRTIGATALPLITAIVSLGSGLALIALLSHAMSVADFATQLATLMILGVGIDYALFIVTRHRRNLLRGMSIQDSIVLALNTSGRAVLFAGTTVCIALLGLWALGVSFLYGVSLGTAIGVAVTMLASLTLLPAMLTILGLKVLPRAQRRAVREGRFVTTETIGFWYRWSRLVEQRKIIFGLAAAAVLLVLAVPFLSIRLGSSDQGNDPAGSTTRKGYDLIAQGFGRGYNSSLEVVVAGPGATDQAYLASVATAVKGVANVDAGSVRTIPLNKTVALVSLKSTTAPQDAKTTELVKGLRKTVLPPLKSGGNQLYVYGSTAIFVDFAKVLSAKMPLFFTAVIGLSFLLLLVAFRSVVVPLTSAAMNLLAAGASFGIVVAIFQWGWFSDALGAGRGGPIEPFLPVIFFAILFGLSMDYQVFLVSRMHEEWLHTGDNKKAVTTGQSETGGIITAAALIMIAVFGGFILGDERVIKLFGIGLASAILLDAFVVRTFLVPAVMHLCGSSNWWFPRWLDKITPRVSIEAADADQPAPGSGTGAGPDQLVPV